MSASLEESRSAETWTPLFVYGCSACAWRVDSNQAEQETITSGSCEATRAWVKQVRSLFGRRPVEEL